MAAARVLLGIVCCFIAGSCWGADRNFISHVYGNKGYSYGRTWRSSDARAKICAIAENELGIREHQENGGSRVDVYNAYVGFEKVAWCASYVSWVFGQAGYPQPRTAWSPALFPADRLTKDPLAGTVMGIYFKHLKRIAHCGIVIGRKGDLVFSVEGNTNVNGSRNGDGVYRRVRHMRSVYRFADWLKK